MRQWLNNALALCRPSTPKGTRIYAIGDIHGYRDKLDLLLAAIADDASQQPAQNTVAVLLGDYIDRGPDSRAVLERLSSETAPIDFIALRGNHEAMLLRFLEEPRILEKWRSFGGVETLNSYGVDTSLVIRGTGYEEARNALLASLPKAHLAFLRKTRLCYESGDYYFCHAGIKPGVKLAEQVEDDLLWIRQEFLTHGGRFEKIVVHGHTPVAAPEIRTNRIGIDTGVYITGVLTCLVLEGVVRRFLVSTPSSTISRFDT